MRNFRSAHRLAGRRSADPGLEALEGRALLSGKAAPRIAIQEVAGVTSGSYQLRILGTTKNDVISIADNGTGAAGNLMIATGDGQHYTTTNAISDIRIATGRGKDSVTYELQGDLLKGVTESVLATTLERPLGSKSTAAGGTLQFTVSIAGKLEAGSQLSVVAYADPVAPTTMKVRDSGDIDGDLTTLVLPVTYNGTVATKVGPVNFDFISSATIGTGAGLSLGALGGSRQNVLNASYQGTNNGDLGLLEQGSGAKDAISAVIRMSAASKGSVGNSGSPATVRANGSKGRATFLVSRGADSASPTGIFALIATQSRTSVAQHSANVTSQTSGTNIIV